MLGCAKRSRPDFWKLCILRGLWPPPRRVSGGRVGLWAAKLPQDGEKSWTRLKVSVLPLTHSRVGPAPSAKQKASVIGETAAPASNFIKILLCSMGNHASVSIHLPVYRRIVKRADYYLRVNFLVKRGSLVEGREERGAEQFNQ